jgi:hypothetical protein
MRIRCSLQLRKMRLSQLVRSSQLGMAVALGTLLSPNWVLVANVLPRTLLQALVLFGVAWPLCLWRQQLTSLRLILGSLVVMTCLLLLLINHLPLLVHVLSLLPP